MSLFIISLLSCLGLGDACIQIAYKVPEESESEAGFNIAGLSRDMGLDISQVASRSARLVSDSSKHCLDTNVNNGRLLVKER